jgi:glucose-1-phosphate thymidylyltransferase
MWGIVPAAGIGSRIQPLAFSKELLPVGSRVCEGMQRPCAVSEYLVERMLRGGASKICFVISPGKSDIMEYYGASFGSASIAYVVQPRAVGLCDSIFRASPLIGPDEHVIVGLPDTVWFPEDALSHLPDDALSFLLFPVAQPQLFDAVLTDRDGRVREIRVKDPDPGSHWIWGAFKMPGHVFHELKELWEARAGRDEYIGTLVNAYIASGAPVHGVKAGESYVDVGTVHGYRTAMTLLSTPEVMREAHIPAHGVAHDQRPGRSMS